MKILIAFLLSISTFLASADIATTNTMAYSPYTTGAFGDNLSSPLTPVINGDWVNGINSQIATVGTPLNGATGDTLNGRLRLQTGTNTAGAVAVVSKKPIRYRQGEGSIIRFTAAFQSAFNIDKLDGTGKSETYLMKRNFACC